jgi:hypothetical protein
MNFLVTINVVASAEKLLWESRKDGTTGARALLRSGNFVSLATPVNVDILNPFSAGAVGMMVGLFCDKAFSLVDSVFASKSKPPTAEADKVTVGAARMTSSPIVAH